MTKRARKDLRIPEQISAFTQKSGGPRGSQKLAFPLVQGSNDLLGSLLELSIQKSLRLPGIAFQRQFEYSRRTFMKFGMHPALSRCFTEAGGGAFS